MKKKAAKRVRLPEAEFFRLLAKFRTLDVVRLEAQRKAARLAAEMVEQEIKAVATEGRTLFDTLAAKHGFDATRHYQFDEAACELVDVTEDTA